MMLTCIAYGCDIDRDPAQNRINHQAMVDRLADMTRDDGWTGVEVVSLYTHSGSTFIEIEPGEAVLTLDLLRGVKEAGGRRRPREEPEFDGDEGRLV
jgi:hypothetical protein